MCVFWSQFLWPWTISSKAPIFDIDIMAPHVFIISQFAILSACNYGRSFHSFSATSCFPRRIGPRERQRGLLAAL